MGDKNFKWWAGGGSQPETYSGPLDTREEALARGKADYPEGDFTICEADRAVVRFDMFDADQVLEQFEEHNLECWGEDGPQISPDSAKKLDLEKRLADTLEKWMDETGETPRAWCFDETRNEEYFPPVNDDAAQ